MKKFAGIISFLFFAVTAYAQQVTNVQAMQQAGQKMRIEYTLETKTGVSDYDIKLFVSTDGGKTWQQVLNGLSGDIGKTSSSGHKTIVWDVLADRDKLQGEDIRFKVTASFNDFGNYTETAAGVDIDMIAIKGGNFTMGDNFGDGDSNEKPLHDVTLSDFYMGKTEVTNAQFCKFLNEKGNQTEGGAEWIDLSGKYDDEKCRIYKSGSTYNVESGYGNYPVIFVSWYGAQAYCSWLNEKTEKKYRLPTEAEWEYAARSGGKKYKYSWGNGNPTKTNGGNIADETTKAKYSSYTIWEDYTDGYVYTAPVNSFGTNEIGIADMSGNVWEWCSDCYGDYPSSAQTNPQGPSSGAYRVYRGGGWKYYARYCRTASRSSYTPTYRLDTLGFRVVSSQVQ